jgi:hypothetical protein
MPHSLFPALLNLNSIQDSAPTGRASNYAAAPDFAFAYAPKRLFGGGHRQFDLRR